MIMVLKDRFKLQAQETYRVQNNNIKVEKIDNMMTINHKMKKIKTYWKLRVQQAPPMLTPKVI